MPEPRGDVRALVREELLACEQLPQLVIVKLGIVLLPHLLVGGAHLWDGFVLMEYLVVFALLDQAVVLESCWLIRRKVSTRARRVILLAARSSISGVPRCVGIRAAANSTHEPFIVRNMLMIVCDNLTVNFAAYLLVLLTFEVARLVAYLQLGSLPSVQLLSILVPLGSVALANDLCFLVQEACPALHGILRAHGWRHGI